MSTTEVDIEVHTLQVTTLSSRRVKIRYDDVTVSNRVNLVDPICVRSGPNPDSIIGEANVQNPSLQPNTPPRLPAKTEFKFNI